MERKQEILKLFEKSQNKEIVINLIDEIPYLEERLIEYKKEMALCEPINPKTKEKFKFYHSLYEKTLSQYTNITSKLASILNKEEAVEDSPLQTYFKKLKGDK